MANEELTFDPSALEAALDSVVAQATTFADLVDKYVDAAAGIVEHLPVVGSYATEVKALVDGVTHALDALNAALHPVT